MGVCGAVRCSEVDWKGRFRKEKVGWEMGRWVGGETERVSDRVSEWNGGYDWKERKRGSIGRRKVICCA